MDITTVRLAILTICIVIKDGVLVGLILLVRKWKRLIEYRRREVLNK